MVMRAFVSGQLAEKQKIRQVYALLRNVGIAVTHDWTLTDTLVDYRQARPEAGRRAALDIHGVLTSDLYILLSDNEKCGKGMYVELGAALALAERFGSPNVFVVGPMNHESIFYHHPLVNQCATIQECLSTVLEGSTGSSQATPGTLARA